MRPLFLALPLLPLFALPAAAQDYITFQAPSGNIHCAISSWDPAEARCDIDEYTPSFPGHPDWCDGDYGFAFAVQTTGAGSPICASDTVRDPQAPVLPYGRSIGMAGLTCSSAETGMTCVNASGHGFTLSRRSQRVF